MFDFETKIRKIANTVGIQINGDQPWDIQVHDGQVYKRVSMHGTLGLGESCMQGMWNCQRLDLLFEKILAARLETNAHLSLSVVALVTAHLLSNLQSIARSTKVAEVHYDLNNGFYQKMLGKHMIYSCGYWHQAKTLDDAQNAKLRMVCDKLELKEGETLLDIGCGWGEMARYAAQNYGVKVTGITISKEQAKLARELCVDLPVEILLQDYRKVEGEFDKIVSIGVFENVGPRNYKTYMQVVNDKLKDEGLFLLHTIGHRYRTFTADPWANKYIFSNGKIPYINHIGKSINGLLILEDWHNFGMDYGKTLSAWHENFALHWPEFKQQYEDNFRRMWRYYLLSFAGVFNARHMQLWQMILTKPSRTKMSRSIR